jgi:hypothetical protein
MPWPCPNCSKAQIKVKKSIEEESFDTTLAKRYTHPQQKPDIDIRYYAGSFKCESCSFNGSFLATYEYDEYHNHLMGRASDHGETLGEYKARSFYPPVLPFKIPANTPQKVKKAIRQMASTIFLDESIPLNRLRVCLEVICDEVGIDKTMTNRNGKVVDITLHSRLEKLEEKYKKIALLTIPAKIIGNTGSHQLDVKRTVLLDGLEFLDSIVYRLYDNEDDRLLKTVEKYTT